MAGDADAKEKRRFSLLCLIDMATGEEREIMRCEGNLEAPFFRSRDELCYNTGGRIHRMNLATGERDILPTGSKIRCNNDHVFSKDGRYLFISNGDEGVGSRIYVTEVGSEAEPRLITPLAPSYLHGVSPDGGTIAYCACRGGEYDVYTMPVEGGAETRLTCTPGLCDGPEYSPDGKKIYFCSVRCGNMECFVMDADGSNQTRLTGNGRHNWFPHISHDGGKIAYISYDPAEVKPGDHPPDRNVQLRLMNADGSDDRCLVSFFGGQGSLNVNSMRQGTNELAYVKYEIL